MGVEKKVFSFRLDEEFVERLKIQADKQNRNLTNFVETVLKAELEKLENAEETKNDK